MLNTIITGGKIYPYKLFKECIRNLNAKSPCAQTIYQCIKKSFLGQQPIKKYSFTQIAVIKTSVDDFESKNIDISFNDAKAAHIDAW